MSPKLDQGLANTVIGRVASVFKQNRVEIIKDAKESGIQSVVYSKILKEDNDFDFAFFAGKVSSFHLLNFLEYKKLVKTDLYANYEMGRQICESLGASSYAYALGFGGTIWVIFKSSDYSGDGAILCKDPTDDEFFVIETLSNFLNRYRVFTDEDNEATGTELVD